MNSLYPLINNMLPELILVVAACVLFLLGVSSKASVRAFTPVIAAGALLAVVFIEFGNFVSFVHPTMDDSNVVHMTGFSHYIKLLSAAMGVLLVLLAWPTNRNRTGGSALEFGQEAGEFYGLMLLSIAGLFLVAGANDIMLMFLGIELASIPTYIMVSISRPLPVAQEAGVKYFFLGAMAAAIMLFGFSYLYGTTGTTTLIATSGHGHPQAAIADVLAAQMAHGGLTTWQMLAIVMLIAGFAFKMAAVPLHVYAADVYQGAATPVTAFLSFVPKASGFVALIKILYAVGGYSWRLPPEIGKLLWWLAVLTMTFGNVLGLLQFNVKRVLAYSSIAHTGYMLVGITALAYAQDFFVKQQALQGVVFYLSAYGLMNVAAFGVLILLPSRNPQSATSAETFEDIAGQGRKHLGLGLAMAVACFSLIGLPLTVGFFGKFLLLKPALAANLVGLVVITMINAAISAAYYLKIVASLFLRPEPVAMGSEFRAVGGALLGRSVSSSTPEQPSAVYHQWPITAAVAISVVAMLVFGTILPVTEMLTNSAAQAKVDDHGPIPAPEVTASTLNP